MMDNTIQVKNNNIIRFKIADEDGVETGDFLEFDLEDIEMPLRFQEMLEKDKKNKQWIHNQINIIDRKEDVKGKKLLSKNEEDKLQALNEFFRKEKEVYDMFLGEGGVDKLLQGRKLGWTTFSEIDDIITTYIAPKLELNMDSISTKIKEKYAIKNEEENVLE